MKYIAFVALVICTACVIEVGVFAHSFQVTSEPTTPTPTATPTRIPASTSTPSTMPTCDYCVPYDHGIKPRTFRIVVPPDEDKINLSQVRQWAEEWDTATGLDIFRDDGEYALTISSKPLPQCNYPSATAYACPYTNTVILEPNRNDHPEYHCDPRTNNTCYVELWTCRAIVIHEIGHILGLLDRYSNVSQEEVGQWIMGFIPAYDLTYFGGDDNPTDAYGNDCARPINPLEAETVRFIYTHSTN